jgi:signal transduction histidine kinase
MRLSYRARITVTAAAVSGLMLAIVLVTLVGLVAHAERDAQEDDLKLAFGQAVNEYRESPKTPDFQEVADGYPGVEIQLSDGHGHILRRAGAKLTVGPILEHTELFDDRLLLVQASTHHVEQRISRLQLLAGLLWLPLTGLIALVVWVAANSVFRPLRQMAEFASRLENDQLTQRLPKVYGGEYDAFADDLNGLLDRVQAAVIKQEQFAYDAAHELRTPLAIISGLLQEELATKSVDDRKLTRRALEETDRLSAISEMLLTSARKRAGHAADSCRLEPCIERCAARWLDRYTEKGIGLELSTQDVEVQIGVAELETVIDNLLANAFVASDPRTTVQIRSFLEGDRAVIEVQDEGTGIPPEMTVHVFEPFVRIDSGRSRKDGGFGLGLAICKRLISERGGSIGVHGSTFRIELKVTNGS